MIELGTMVAAPFATHILSQLGAEVIKVEPPSGDTTRALVRGGPSGTLIAYSHSKKAICLDLTRDEGRDVFNRLVASADAVIHNLSPSASRKLGVTFEDCHAANRQIVHCHIKGLCPWTTGRRSGDQSCGRGRDRSDGRPPHQWPAEPARPVLS